MKIFYACCFWLSLITVLLLSALAMFQGKTELIKDFALPMAASIFAFGQLWQQEKQNEFEQKKFIKEHYFELMKILNDVLILEADTSRKDFPQEFSRKCIMQCHQLVLVREKILALFDDKLDELEPLLVVIKHNLENMSIIMHKSVKTPSPENQDLFNANFLNFAKDIDILSAFLRKCYEERIICG